MFLRSPQCLKQVAGERVLGPAELGFDKRQQFGAKGVATFLRRFEDEVQVGYRFGGRAVFDDPNVGAIFLNRTTDDIEVSEGDTWSQAEPPQAHRPPGPWCGRALRPSLAEDDRALTVLQPECSL